MAKVLLVIAPENFRDEEYYEPKAVLEGKGNQVVTCSLQKEATSKFGKKQGVDVLLGEVSASVYDAVAFIGGAGSCVYFDDEKAHSIARELAAAGKVVAAICIAPSTLANAGLLRGKKATAYPSQEDDLKRHGADYTGEPVTVDGKIVTASGPQAAKQFGEEIARQLK